MKITKIKNDSHKHVLHFRRSPKKAQNHSFICDGCKQRGFGCRYSCSNCDFDLHKERVLPPDPVYHPFIESCKLDFKPRIRRNKTCDACSAYIVGFGYRSSCKTYNFHPTCANLQRKIEKKAQGDSIVVLKLTDNIRSKCLKCGDKKQNGNKYWAYKCGDYCLHVSCLMKMSYDAWEQSYVGGNNGETSRLALARIESSGNKTCFSKKFKKLWSAFKVIFTAFYGSEFFKIASSAFTMTLKNFLLRIVF